MSIVQQNSGVFNGTSFTVTLPAPSVATNVVVVIVAGNTTVTTPAGWTLRSSQVNFMGHYLYDRAGGSASYAFTNSAGQGTWWIAEIYKGVFDTAPTGQNATSANTTYNTQSITPGAGTRLVVASLASVATGGAARTISGWTNSFVEQVDLCQTTGATDAPMQGVAVLDNLAANGSTAQTTTATYSASSTGRSALIASYSTRAQVSTTRATTWNTLKAVTHGNSYVAEVLADSPIVYYRLGDSGSTMVDASGNGRDGTYTAVTLGTAGLLAGDPDTAATFDGTTSYGTRAYDAAMGVSTFSAEAIITPSSVTGTRTMASRHISLPGGSGQLVLRLDGNLIRFYIKDGTSSFFFATSSVNAAIGLTQHVVGTYDGATIRVYVNGVQTGSTAHVGVNNSGTAPFDVGCSHGTASAPSEFFAGVLDEVALYSGALSPQRIAAHYAQVSNSVWTRTSWRTLAQVSATRSTTWNVAAASSTTPVSTTRSTTWNVKAPVTATRSTTWRVVARTSTTRATTWRVRSALTATRSTTWRVRSALVATRATTWRVLAQAVATRATTWDVASALTQVSTTRAASWDALARVSATRATTWDVLSKVTAARSTSWDVLGAVAATRATTWNVASALIVVSTSRSTTWRVIAHTSAARVASWDVLARISTTRATTWDVLTPAATSRATTWRVKGAASTSRAASWDVLERVANARGTTWDVFSPTAASRATTWDVRALVATARVTTWNVATPDFSGFRDITATARAIRPWSAVTVDRYSAQVQQRTRTAVAIRTRSAQPTRAWKAAATP